MNVLHEAPIENYQHQKKKNKQRKERMTQRMKLLFENMLNLIYMKLRDTIN